jgi:hypothetical protein
MLLSGSIEIDNAQFIYKSKTAKTKLFHHKDSNLGPHRCKEQPPKRSLDR